jgi:head-tail adaptor
MKIIAGRLDRRADLLAPVTVRNPANGEATIDWQVQGTRSAAVLRLLPTDTVNEEQLIAKAQAKLLMRLDSLTRTILPTWRVAYDGTTYDVVGTDPTPADGSVLVYIVGLPA